MRAWYPWSMCMRVRPNRWFLVSSTPGSTVTGRAARRLPRRGRRHGRGYGGRVRGVVPAEVGSGRRWRGGGLGSGVSRVRVAHTGSRRRDQPAIASMLPRGELGVGSQPSQGWGMHGTRRRDRLPIASVLPRGASPARRSHRVSYASGFVTRSITGRVSSPAASVRDTPRTGPRAVHLQSLRDVLAQGSPSEVTRVTRGANG